MNETFTKADLDEVCKNLFSDGNVDDDVYKSKHNFDQERLETTVEQVLGALSKGERPYKTISRKEMKKRFGDFDGYTNFNDVYVVDDLTEGARAFTVPHEYLHKETHKGSDDEKEVLDLTYNILEFLKENECVDPEVRELARRGYIYGKINAKRFYGDCGIDDFAFQGAGQPAAEGEGEERQPTDELIPYLWKVPLGALDYIMRIPQAFVGNLLNMGSGNKGYTMKNRTGISNLARSATGAYKKWIGEVRQEEREMENRRENARELARRGRVRFMRDARNLELRDALNNYQNTRDVDAHVQRVREIHRQFVEEA